VWPIEKAPLVGVIGHVLGCKTIRAVSGVATPHSQAEAGPGAQKNKELAADNGGRGAVGHTTFNENSDSAVERKPTVVTTARAAIFGAPDAGSAANVNRVNTYKGGRSSRCGGGATASEAKHKNHLIRVHRRNRVEPEVTAKKREHRLIELQRSDNLDDGLGEVD